MNAIGQRQTVSTSGTAMASPATTRWSYDALGQLVAEDFANNQAANPRDRGYAYDLIGNRENSIQGNTNPLAAGNLSYDANPLNQYTSIGAFQPVHDDDGNLTTGQLHASALSSLTGTPYTGTLHWNAENRLTKVEDGSTLKATYQYDFMGRRVRKQVGSIVTWYVYDGFNELARFTQSGGSAPVIERTFTWGLDISNSPQGAGGVGGLLAVKVHGTTSATYFPTYDANGNISEYLASNGSVAAHFEYDGFGNTVVNTDTNGLFDYRFSTKPLEDVTGLYYYLYRDYDPVTGRWASRDPIKERGGLNLYGLVRNNPVGDYDRLGLEGCKSKLLTYQHYFSVAPPDGFTVQNWRQWAHGWADLLLSDGGWEGTASGGAGALIFPSWSKVSITFGASIVCSSKKSSGPESDEDCVASLSTSGKYSESDGITSIGVEADPGAAGVSNIISVDFTATVGYGGSSSVGAGVGNYSANLSFPDGAVHTSIAVGTGTWRCECSK